MKTLLAAALTLALAGCAASPENIAPAYVSYLEYNDLTCAQMGMEAPRLDYALAAASDQQSATHTADALGVLLVGLPTGSMSGQNVALEVARLKGKAEAIREAMIHKNCTTEIAIDRRSRVE